MNTRFYSSLQALTRRALKINVPVFFLITAGILNLLYIASFSPLSDYWHGPQRFFHVVHIAYSVVYDDPDYLPVSMLETLSHAIPSKIADVARNACSARWPKNIRSSYCKRQWHEIYTLRQLAAIPLNPQDTFSFRSHEYAANFPVIGYLPQVGVAILGVWLEWPPIIILYGSVIFNALVITLLGYQTLRLLPCLRWPVCYLLLMPASFKLRMFIMPDALAIDLSYLMFAIAVHFKYYPRIFTLYEKAGLILLSIAAATTKVCYGLLPMVFLVIPASCFGGRSRQWAIVAYAIILSLAISSLWGMSILQKYHGDRLSNTMGITHSSSLRKLEFIAMNPIRYSSSVFDAFLRKDNLTKSFKNIMDWPNDYFSSSIFLMLPLLLLCLFESGVRPTERFFTLQDRTIALYAFLMGVMLIYTIRFFYMQHSLQESTRQNFYTQGRYFLPLVPFLFIIWHQAITVKESLRKWIMFLIVIFTLGCLAYLNYKELSRHFLVYLRAYYV